eukprot:m.41589 g.41589  ORF g.41589 m.41589 type:complete len:368 (-) comp12840_c0_seq2:134-1237(-)
MELPSYKVSITAADADEQIKRQLDEDGYVVVTDLYTPAQCEAMREEFTELARKLHPEWVDEEGEFHFQHDEFLASFKGGMGHCGPINHQQYVWDIRQDERIVDLFAKVYDVGATELYTSMDALCIREPNEYKSDGPEMREWYHTDQTYSFDFVCLQGMLTLQDMPKDESPLRVWPGAHNMGLLPHLTKEGDTNNYIRIAKDKEVELDSLFPNLRKRFYVDAPAGSIVLWDSRLPHMGGRSPVETRGRHVVYVSYQPKAWLGQWHNFDTPEEARQWCLQRRCDAFNELLRTTHWASSIVRVADKPAPHFRGISKTEHDFITNPEKYMKLPQLTDLGRSLVGLDDLEPEELLGSWSGWLRGWLVWLRLA